MPMLNAYERTRKVEATLSALDAALAVRDPETYGHGKRTAAYAVAVARRLGLAAGDLLALERGCALHDIGKLHVPARILHKAERLTEPDWKLMRSHAVTSYAMISTLPELAQVAAIVLAHHERYDGMGYPHRLEGEDIPLGARICALADCYDALTVAGPGRPRAMTVHEACRYLALQAGRQFDPEVVRAWLSIDPVVWQEVQRTAGRAGTGVHTGRPEPSMSDFDKAKEKVVAFAGVSSLPCGAASSACP